MADDQDDPIPEDIPGASFSEEEIKWFWSKCRRIKSSGFACAIDQLFMLFLFSTTSLHSSID